MAEDPSSQCLGSVHGDIWTSLQHFVSTGNLPLPIKVKSHVLEHDTSESRLDLQRFRQHLANSVADAAATAAARLYDHASCAMQKVEKYLTQTFLVLIRLSIF